MTDRTGHPPRSGSRTLARRPAPWLLILAIALVATVLRGPIVAIAPVIDTIQRDLALTAGQSGLLTSIPVLCFSLLTPVAILVISRVGADAAITVCLVGVLLGTVIRSSDGTALAIAGTVLIGASITIGNVVVPVVIRRDFPPRRVNMVTGIYTSSLNVGSTITSLGTAPLADALGWRMALIVWIAFAVVAIAAWTIANGRRALAPKRTALDPVLTGEMPIVGPRVWRSLSVVLLAAAFAGQAFSYYGVTAWLPTLLVDENGFSLATAGASSSVFQIAAVVGALGVPLVLARLQPLGTIVLLGWLWVTVPLGLILAPHLWLLWCVLGGTAQGGGITVIFVIIVRISTSDTHASRLSATVQGVGYAIAATAPTVIGFVHDTAGDWTAALLVVLVAVLTFTGAGAAAALRTPGGRR